jgi:hypothetical protein
MHQKCTTFTILPDGKQFFLLQFVPGFFVNWLDYLGLNRLCGYRGRWLQCENQTKGRNRHGKSFFIYTCLKKYKKSPQK